MKTKHFISIILLLCIIGYSLFISTQQSKEGFETDKTAKQKVFVINLDKDKKRYQEFMEYYHDSDFLDIPCERFPAINGKNVNCNDYLSEHAKQEFYEVNTQGYRTKHHQLTYGGMGCFLSHYTLAKQLLNEKEDNTQYIVFEDDIICKSNTKRMLDKYTQKAPKGWDFLSFQQWKLKGDNVNKYYKKPNSFWGTGLYIINKSGARKLLDEVNSVKIDGQIDAYLSRMSQQNKMNIYACSKHFTNDNSNNFSNIQILLKEKPGVNPVDYFGILL